MSARSGSAAFDGIRGGLGVREPAARDDASSPWLARCALAALVAFPAAAFAQSELLGEWLLTISEGNEVHRGILTLEQRGAAIAGFVEGGPVPVTLGDGEIALEADYRDGGGRYLVRKLSGTASAERMQGTVERPLGAPPGSWFATPRPASDAPPPPPDPVDFSGIWSRTSSGLAKVDLDYTPEARAAVDGYSYLDDPALRCVSPGVVRVSGWPYPLEIIQTENQLTILYESFHEVRRIWLDGRDLPEGVPHRAMGYSRGHWEGSTLVVETEMLLGGYVDLAGQPLSANAHTVERMSLRDEGRTLLSEMTVYDPENYRRPITRHRTWRKTPETVILEYDCDPYPFFRGLALEGRLEEYWDRMRQRH